MDKAILITFLLFIVCVFALGYITLDINACFSIEGIDHNKSNDPFTVFIGDC